MDAVTRMANRIGNTMKIFSLAVQGRALLPIFSTVWYIFPCFYSVVLIAVMILRARFVLVWALAWEDPRRGTRVPRVNATYRPGTDHAADLCISPGRQMEVSMLVGTEEDSGRRSKGCRFPLLASRFLFPVYIASCQAWNRTSLYVGIIQSTSNQFLSALQMKHENY